MWIFLSCSILCWLICFSGSQTLNTTTIPPVANGNFPLISAHEDSENVTMFCKVIQISSGLRITTQWSLIRNSSDTIFLRFNLNGTGREFFENMMTTSIDDFQSNLTIFVFNSSFDNAQIGCGAGGEVAGRFDLRILSE